MKQSKEPHPANLRRRAQERLNTRKPAVEPPASVEEAYRLLHELQVHQIELEMQNEDLQQLRAQEEAATARYTELYDFAPVGYFSLGRNGEITQANLAGARLLGRDRAILAGRQFRTFVFQADLPLFNSCLESALTATAGNTCEVRLTTHDEPERIALIELSLSPDGCETRAVVMDRTESKQLEDRLRQSQKMEGIGHLAAGMAHEFNNILAALRLNLSLARNSEPSPAINGYLGDMEELSRRAADLIKQLLAFSRQSVMRLRPVDLSEVVSTECRLFARLLGERITIRFSRAAKPAWVNADRTLVEQVLLNLCLNAKDAMQDGGTLRLELQELEIGSALAQNHERAQPGKHVVLAVTDTGCGMDERTMKRLFEPFFTTKSVGTGTGLGLATVRGIVEQLHGWVEVESKLGQGATFRVFLPLLELPVPPPPLPPPGEKACPSQGATILLVEDDAMLRKSTRTLLNSNGYVVLEAANGQEALAMWEKHHAEVDIIFTDRIMPGQPSGLELAELALAQKPTLKVIVTSGYHVDQVDLDKASSMPIVYLSKPCGPEDLLNLMRQLRQRG